MKWEAIVLVIFLISVTNYLARKSLRAERLFWGRAQAIAWVTVRQAWRVGTLHTCSWSLLLSKWTRKQKSECQWSLGFLLVPFCLVGNSVLWGGATHIRGEGGQVFHLQLTFPGNTLKDMPGSVSQVIRSRWQWRVTPHQGSLQPPLHPQRSIRRVGWLEERKDAVRQHHVSICEPSRWVRRKGSSETGMGLQVILKQNGNGVKKLNIS